MNVADVTAGLEQIAPVKYAAEWDNVGLLLGSESWEVPSLLLTIDLTEPVLREALDGGAGMILAYHPPIFHPIRSLTSRESLPRLLLEAARAGVAVYSPHTALDAAPGGINDWLARGLGIGDVKALQAHEALPESEQYKIVTFCPAAAVDELRNGLASIGAGHIGDYELCSFEMRGQGTFLGSPSTQPAVGMAGRLERVDELRLEMVCSQRALSLAVMALRQFHPYEEPPIEIYAQRGRPQRGIGHGRRVRLDQKVDLASLIERLKRLLRVRSLKVAAVPGGSRRHQTIGLCAGAGGALLEAALGEGCDLFVTGEMRHHDVLAATARGCAVILAGHTNTERPYLGRLRAALRRILPDLKVALSRKDVDPLRLV